jgi:hypothetical protein
MTDWPSPFEFQFAEDKGVAIGTPSTTSSISEYGAEAEDLPVSPVTAEGDYNRGCFDDHLRPHDSQMPRKYAFVDDEDDFAGYDEEDEEQAAAEAWFHQRTGYLDSSERINLAQSLPAFSAYNAPSAVPEALHPRPRYAKEQEADETTSWYSATVHTYVPKRGPPEAMPRPSSSHYASAPRRSRYSTAEAALRKDPPVPWEQWEKRFVHEETLARLEGR